MIVDLDSSRELGELSCDICVVGAGAAGLSLATQLLNTRLQTVVLESGGMEAEAATQALYDVEISGRPHRGAIEGRFRICGGSTTRWGGQALPLMQSDFEHRPWVPNSGWPINFEELRPFYSRASQFLLVDDRDYDRELLSYLSARPSPFDPQKLWYHFSKWSPKPSLRETYLPGICASETCTLLLHANATDINLSRNLTVVDNITARSLSGRHVRVNARIVILCAGGIEVPRLLLANSSQQKNGIGNGHDLVGRFFQDHPNAFVGSIKSDKPDRIQKLFNVFHRKGLKYSVRCTAAPSWQRERQTLNASMGITFVQDGTAFQELRDLYSSIRARKLTSANRRQIMRIARSPSQSIAPVWHYIARGRSFSPGAGLSVGLTCEQEPDKESRIQLGEKKDQLGMPSASVHWKISDATWRTMRLFADLLSKEFLRAGLGEIQFEDWLNDPTNDWQSRISDQYHHMGTTRMNDSPRLGVVDRNCRVHGISNLYVASSSVFPTSGHSNPTLTILALCMRMADELRRSLA